LGAGRLAHTDHERGLSQARQDAAGHFAKQYRSFIRSRVDQASEGVEVVASDDHAAMRQVVSEMRVAMIDYVEDVALLRTPAQVARVVEKAIQQSINVLRRSSQRPDSA